MLQRLIPLLLTACWLLPINTVLAAPLKIVIEGGVDNPLPIAVIPFSWSQASQVAPIDLATIISQNLARSGRFDVIAEQDLPQRPDNFAAINFGDWRKLGVENILIGQLILTNSGDYNIRFRLVDIYRGKEIVGFQITAAEAQLRKVAHRISDMVFEKLTGRQGVFATRIAYITISQQAAETLHTLWIADADGYNPQALLRSTEPLLSPAWSPDAKKLAYVSFEGKNSAIFIDNIATQEPRQQLAAFAGINSAPAWSPDGEQLAMTLSKDGNPEIYIADLRTNALRRITNHSAIDTEPAWSPDGRKLAFTSDRSGSPQIYEIALPDGQPKRLSFQGRYNARAAYAPDGQSIALVHGAERLYKIGLLDLASGDITILTDSRLDESPSFAPNGDMIIYTTTTVSQGTQLATVSSDGRIHQRLRLQRDDVREPAWGPLLP